MKCDTCRFKDEIFVNEECQNNILKNTQQFCKSYKKKIEPKAECDKCGAYTKLKYTKVGDYCEQCLTKEN